MNHPFCIIRSVCRVRYQKRPISSSSSQRFPATFRQRIQISQWNPCWDRSQHRKVHHVETESHRKPCHIEPQSRCNSHTASIAQPLNTPIIPQTCPGCGALSQAANPNDAGFYSRSRKSVKSYLQYQSGVLSYSISTPIIGSSSKDVPQSDGVKSLADGTICEGTVNDPITSRPEVPVCDRCHNLIHNNQGTSIVHPTLEDLADSIAESPFRRNHIYHVLDAADFPMSLIPKIFSTLEVARLRGQNRRARTKYSTKPTISFIITRSDLLGPSKEMVDKMMPYFQDLLRSALGRQARNTRLGNVHLVSAKRGWWTKELKDDIWQRGGGNWMVGKVNVGKSNLFPVLFPKGSGERAPVYAELQEEHQENVEHEQALQSDDYLREDSLLPPAQPEVRFPAMPIVSHLPGTTASPIRLSFGHHKGELVDLPGLGRGNLEHYVQTDHKLDLVMQHRPNVTQHVIKPGQSLLLGGGLIRITPQLDSQDRSMTMLAYPFVPIDAHVTATEKAIALQQQERDSGVKSILADGAGLNISSSGKYALTTDITKIRASPLLRAGVPLSKLPFKVFSTDILIEGVGWVELVCQVQKSKGSDQITIPEVADINATGSATADVEAPKITSPDTDQPGSDFKPFFQQTPESLNGSETDATTVPILEIFSPHGKHIGQRKPLGAWMLWEKTRAQRRDAKSNVRPRKSMKGSKKRAKAGQ